MNLNLMDDFKKLKTMLISEEPPPPKYGSSDGLSEDKCKEIQVFMIASGGISGFIGVEERRRKLMNIGTTLRDARNQFGTCLSQDLIKDENGFMFVDDDFEKPIFKFSNQCKLNLNFVFSNRGQLDSYKTVITSKHSDCKASKVIKSVIQDTDKETK